MIQPSPIASVMQPASAGLASSSQRRGVTPLVLLLKRSGNISARSWTVTVRSSSEWIAATPLVLCEPTIARFAMRILRSPPSSTRLTRSSAALVAREAAPHLRDEAAVDLEDDLEVPRQQQLEPAQRPFLQRLGQQRVVGVGERPSREVPGLVPAEARLVEQDPHQLGHGQARMGVVELDRDLVGQARSSRRCGGGSAARGRRASRRRGSTPARSAAPAHARRVVGVEDARQGFGGQPLGQRADELAGAERLEVEVVGRAARPRAGAC